MNEAIRNKIRWEIWQDRNENKWYFGGMFRLGQLEFGSTRRFAFAEISESRIMEAVREIENGISDEIALYLADAVTLMELA